jgi:S-adenosylmethionine:tRNA ribosyltransferase-isomerase
LRLERTGALLDYLERYGEVPLPPYIGRAANAADASRYQTLYARHPGAAAAPTAGLHFDGAMLDSLASAGIAIAYVTLHVGAGTFQPVESEDLTRHTMHAERYRIPRRRPRPSRRRAHGAGASSPSERRACARWNHPRRRMETSRRVKPKRGSSSRRAIVSAPSTGSSPTSICRSRRCWYSVAAFTGYTNIRAAYAHAIAQRYRFFSYGDAMLLERDP